MGFPEGSTSEQYSVDLASENTGGIYDASIGRVLGPVTGQLGVMPTDIPTNSSVLVGMPNFNVAQNSDTLSTTNVNATPPAMMETTTGVAMPSTAAATTTALASPSATESPSPTTTTTVVTNSKNEKITGAGIAAVAVTCILCFAIVIGGILVNKWLHRWKANRHESRRHVFAGNSSVVAVGTTTHIGSGNNRHQRFYDEPDEVMGSTNDTDVGLFAPASNVNNRAMV